MAEKQSPESRQQRYSFLELENKKCIFNTDKNIIELFQKWGVKMHVQYYSYDQMFQSYMKDDFMQDFFQDSTVTATLKVLNSKGIATNLGNGVARVESTPVACTQTSMAFFDRLQEESIVRENGSIAKCFDEFYEDFTIADELRKMLLLEDSDNYEVYSDKERDEFLFRLLKHISLGGPVCQYEDNVTPYLDTTKTLYKDLISVHKDKDTKQLRVSSVVYRLKAWDKDSTLMFPCDTEHQQNVAYMIIDPLKRHITILHHRWAGSVW
ncbi:cilia- and flagella-associated protein 300-like [Anneissia japonica]|uniref:cilia- and flagella-associated protein 300-like n=1 Tax=Anneissia japonica TaxID=1529436 RepID=UPI0014254BF0|nr:cilia- and flagella-associated protein 300-like [Anneissia japonica]